MTRIIPLILALALAGCTTSQFSIFATDLNAVANALNASAQTLPDACTNLSVAINTVSNTPNLPSKISTALNNGNDKYTPYCQAGAAVTVAVSTAINNINTFIQSLKKQLAAASTSGS